ncbi:Serine proteinase inhibitor [Scale drop disease virus]|uniref:ORF_097L n=1 Tax=Scale drop disease virus TaxID=1697349 RepID=A0A0K1L6B1_9VIRU|nr:ORF_097L [Scale drop disease virus]AKU37512.1 ORF_097L [Scale drop disease virus]QLI60771.1 Serine proteinase inhibitor [Scale drop disease virus]QXJ13689.1 ORF097L [Scale drop disease virus]UNH60684.1 Serine proteinase inhibitor [Scale drop disease virus]
MAFVNKVFAKIFVPGKNVCVSPVGISDTLRTVNIGTRGLCDSQLREFLEDVKRLPLSKYSSTRIFIDNAYPAILTDIKNVDFINVADTMGKINNWVRQKTEGKITSILSSLDPHSKLVVVNAVYLKEFWKRPFEDTDLHKFNHIDGTSHIVEMMMDDSWYNVGQVTEGVDMLEIPYKSKCNMFIILPDEGVDMPTDIYGLVKNRTRLTKKYVTIGIPKFKIESTFDLKRTFPELVIFDDRQCDMSGFTENTIDKLTVSAAKHTAVIEVDETSTEAYASTVLTCTLFSAKTKPTLQFIASRPFIYVVHDSDRDEILFVGQYATK